MREEWVSGSRGQTKVSTPVVRFTTATGAPSRPRRHRSAALGRPQAGDPLEVLYDPANPADVRVRTGAAGLLSGVGNIAVGVLFVVVALTFFA